MSRRWSETCGNQDDVRTAVGRCVEHWGRLDILINNAGVSPDPAQLTDLPVEEWERVIDTNLNGAVRLHSRGGTGDS